MIIQRFEILFVCYVSLVSLSYAGLFPDSDSMDEALDKGRKYAEILYPGILYADSFDGEQCLDYASAFPYPVDGSDQTSAILSCGHFLSQVKTRDPGCKIYFKSADGQIYPVTKTANYWNSSPLQSSSTISTDLAVYEISSKTSCCSKLRVPDQIDSNFMSLKTLSCGWHIDLSGAKNIVTDHRPALWSRDFKVDGGVLSTFTEPDRLLHLSTTGYDQWFFASSKSIAPQTFLHDSGAMWFRKNMGVYELWGLTSHASYVPSLVTQGLQNKTDYEQSCSFLNTPYTLRGYSIKTGCENGQYGNFIANLIGSSVFKTGTVLSPYESARSI